jgi:hypothetical protein
MKRSIDKKELIIGQIIAFIMWGIICYATSQHNAASDGVNKIGWPYMFYLNYSGKMMHFVKPPGFIILHLIIDIAIIFVSGLVISVFGAKLINTKKAP